MYAGLANELRIARPDGDLSLATAIEAIAGVLIALAAATAIRLSLGALGRRESGDSEMRAARELLGSWLSFALEFEVAADILRTAVAPSWSQIGQLTASVALRSALNFVLRAESTDRAGLLRGKLGDNTFAQTPYNLS